jgi:hypothetical protein
MAPRYDEMVLPLACEQALKVNWEPASMTNEFEYLRLKSWREILIGQMQVVCAPGPRSQGKMRDFSRIRSLLVDAWTSPPCQQQQQFISHHQVK